MSETTAQKRPADSGSTQTDCTPGIFIFSSSVHSVAVRVGTGAAPDEAGRAIARCSKTLRALAQRDGLLGLRVVEEPGLPLLHGHSGKVKRVIAARGACEHP